MAKRKYYVVWKGVNPGVYDNWEDCKAQVHGFEGAKFKSFESLSSEISFFKSSAGDINFS